jgi:hypothetical protein
MVTVFNSSSIATPVNLIILLPYTCKNIQKNSFMKVLYFLLCYFYNKI